MRKTWCAQSRGWKAAATGMLLVGLVVILVACGGGADKNSRVTAAEICGATADAPGMISSGDLIETSGIASSRVKDNILWVHNDSGDSARVFAIDRQGRHVATDSLPGVLAIDWEDMAIGPGPEEDTPYLYLADIGDNAAQRPDVTVYRVPEPEVSTTADTPTANDFSEFSTFTFRYPDHPHDAETFMVDPVTGDLFIVTKELATNVSTVFRAPANVQPGQTFTLQQVAQVAFGKLVTKHPPSRAEPPLVFAVPNLPTGGDISPDGTLVAIRTYGSVWVWSRDKDASVADALRGQPCEATSAIEQQGEAIAFDADGRGYVTVSEGSSPPLHHFEVAR